MIKEETNLAEQAEIKRQFCYEHNAELDIVIKATFKKIRVLLNKIRFTQDDMDNAEEMLDFVANFMPYEVYPWRIDTLKNQLWKCINRGVPQKILNKEGKLVDNSLWKKDF